ncbi:unnamed protein product, partial [Amoebophrya sp. A25]
VGGTSKSQNYSSFGGSRSSSGLNYESSSSSRNESRLHSPARSGFEGAERSSPSLLQTSFDSGAGDFSGEFSASAGGPGQSPSRRNSGHLNPMDYGVVRRLFPGAPRELVPWYLLGENDPILKQQASMYLKLVLHLCWLMGELLERTSEQDDVTKVRTTAEQGDVTFGVSTSASNDLDKCTSTSSHDIHDHQRQYKSSLVNKNNDEIFDALIHFFVSGSMRMELYLYGFVDSIFDYQSLDSTLGGGDGTTTTTVSRTIGAGATTNMGSYSASGSGAASSSTGSFLNHSGVSSSSASMRSGDNFFHDVEQKPVFASPNRGTSSRSVGTNEADSSFDQKNSASFNRRREYEEEMVQMDFNVTGWQTDVADLQSLVRSLAILISSLTKIAVATNERTPR